jgi:hypothetical protein
VAPATSLCKLNVITFKLKLVGAAISSGFTIPRSFVACCPKDEAFQEDRIAKSSATQLLQLLGQ